MKNIDWEDVIFVELRGMIYSKKSIIEDIVLSTKYFDDPLKGKISAAISGKALLVAFGRGSMPHSQILTMAQDIMQRYENLSWNGGAFFTVDKEIQPIIFSSSDILGPLREDVYNVVFKELEKRVSEYQKKSSK